MRDKLEIEKIEELISELCNERKSIDKNIPKYLYHFTDILNAVSILKMGCLGSRNFVLQNELMQNDNASSEVINITEEENKNFVRFYFRPKTPTQHHNEGLKSNYKDYDYNSHCPIPIFFLFNSVGILSRENSKFVERNLAKSPPIKTTINDLASFDFQKIYHLGPIYGDRDIIEKRHAEVLVENTCDLDDLEIIVCRSTAEKELLINQLLENGIDISNLTIGVDKRSLLFNKSRAYIDYVELESTFVKIGFVNFWRLSEKDEIILVLTDHNNNIIKKRNLSILNCQDGISFKFQNPIEKYNFRIYLNDILIYLGKCDKGSEIPY